MLERGYDDALARLDSSGVVLLAAHPEPDGRVRATVFLKTAGFRKLATKIQQFQDEDTQSGKPRNEGLVSVIHSIQRAAVRSLWTDQAEFPQTNTSLWWELWLRRDRPLSETREALESGGLAVGSSELLFPERAVLLVHGSTEQLARTVELLESAAELRLAKDSPTVLVDERGPEAADWIADFLGRVSIAERRVAICVLDTGVNAGHPLIKPFVRLADFLASRPAWGIRDIRKHGTLMAGLALFGDLSPLLAGRDSVALFSTVEGVKILPDTEENPRELWGRMTLDGVAAIEITNPAIPRLFSLAVTATDSRDNGRPSSWSSAIDQSAFGDLSGRRLFLIAAGNSEKEARREHPAHLETESCHDPAQAWMPLR